MIGATWDTSQGQWTVDVKAGTEEAPVRYTCNFLYFCTGYYDFDEGYTPQWPDMQKFGGTIVHPQHWPENLDYVGR